MAEPATKLAVKSEPEKGAKAPPARVHHPFENLRTEIDRVFDEFSLDWPRWPFRARALAEPHWRSEVKLLQPAVDVAESDSDFRITAELPGMDEKNVEVVLSEGTITIKGEKSEEKEETKKDYHFTERTYGSFQRSFALPDNVDAEKIDASLKKGVLTLVLPKTADAQKKVRKVAIKAS